MKEVHLTPEKRQELTNWLLENLLGKHCNPILQFLAENEVKTDPTPIGGGGSGGGPRPPKSE